MGQRNVCFQLPNIKLGSQAFGNADRHDRPSILPLQKLPQLRHDGYAKLGMGIARVLLMPTGKVVAPLHENLFLMGQFG